MYLLYLYGIVLLLFALPDCGQVIADKERLKKRTQLRRSVYRILGEGQEEREGAGEESEAGERDSHLRDYNDDIFDDDDFYHQVRESWKVIIQPSVVLVQCVSP